MLLWCLAVIQPASLDEVISFMLGMYGDSLKDFPKSEFKGVLDSLFAVGDVVLVDESNRLYSLTLSGNHKLTKELRKKRDRARLFLLKKARQSMVSASAGGRKKLGDGSSPIDARCDVNKGSRPIALAAGPSGQGYWPRLVEQLDLRVGSSRPPVDNLELLSFPDKRALHRASAVQSECSVGLTMTELALALGVSPALLLSMVARTRRYYRSFSIGKKSGGERPIDAPRTWLNV